MRAKMKRLRIFPCKRYFLYTCSLSWPSLRVGWTPSGRDCRISSRLYMAWSCWRSSVRIRSLCSSTDLRTSLYISTASTNCNKEHREFISIIKKKDIFCKPYTCTCICNTVPDVVVQHSEINKLISKQLIRFSKQERLTIHCNKSDNKLVNLLLPRSWLGQPADLNRGLQMSSLPFFHSSHFG